MMRSGTRITTGSIEGVGRLRLRYRACEAAQPRAGIVVVHGLGEHGGRYDGFADVMAACGISTFCCDLRGHGASEGRRGHVRNFEHYLQDIDRFRREVEGLVDLRLPLFLLGHSMGGLITLRYLEEYDSPFRGAVLSSPWLGTAMPVPRWKVTAANALSKVLPALPFSNGLEPERLSRDPDVVRAYEEDPLVHDVITPRLYAEASAAMGLALHRSDRMGVPLFFALAGSDRVVDTQRSLAFARSIPGTDVTIKVYPGHYHELLNEPDRTAIIRDVREWIAARLL